MAGKLFFKHMQCGLASKFSALTINHIEPELSDGEIILDKESGLICYNRYVCLTSCYNWKDGSKGDGNFRVVVMGHATNNDEMKGTVYILPKKAGATIDDWKQIIIKIKTLKKEIKKAQRDDIDLRIKNRHAEISNELDKFENTEYYKIDYEIDRSGFATFDYHGVDEGHLHEFTLVRQSFYYLKYSIHVHQHHNEGEDSLTTIHMVPDNHENIGEQLLDDLKESMVAMKREQAATNYHRLFDNKGVNCYAKSLVESCKRAKYINQKDYDIQINYLGNVYGSMQTTAEKTERNISLGLSASNSARSTILLLFAIIAPFTLIHLDTIRANISSSLNNDSIAAWLICFISDTASETKGIAWSLIILIAIFLYFRTVKMKYGSLILGLKTVSKFFSRVLHNRIKGYVWATGIFLICSVLVIIAFKYYK